MKRSDLLDKSVRSLVLPLAAIVIGLAGASLHGCRSDEGGARSNDALESADHEPESQAATESSAVLLGRTAFKVSGMKKTASGAT